MVALPNQMKAISITQPGGPEVLQLTDMPLPPLRPGEVMIRVEAAGVNRPDVLQRVGAYPAPPGASPIPGLEVSGEIVSLGEGVSGWAIGDQVCALTAGGGYAQYVAVCGTHCLRLPGGFDHLRAAALPETFFTVWHNVFQRGGLKADEVFLVHGGTSGIGTTAIQLARAFGARVFATAGSEEKCQACLSLGAEVAINYRQDDFVAVVKRETGKKGANLILDMVGGDYISRNFSAAAPDGRIVQIAFLQGAKAEVDFTRLMLKRLTFTGSTLRARDDVFKAALAKELEERVWPLLDSGEIHPVMHEIFPLERANEAHAMMEESKHVGKIVLSVAK